MKANGFVRRLPDLLVGVRFLLLPVLLWLLTQVVGPDRVQDARIIAVGVLLAMGLTDLLDGMLARRFGVVSDRGSALDAAADKLAVLVPLFYWAVADRPAFSHVPLWLPVALLGLDAVMTTLWFQTRRRLGTRPPGGHNQAGRVATFLAFILLGSVALRGPDEVVLWVGATLVVLRVAAVGYYARSWRRGDAGG